MTKVTVPGSDRISVIILNWLRPDNIKHQILPTLAKCPIIGEVIISHGRRDTAFSWSCPFFPVRHRDDSNLNQQYGLSLRFVCANEAQYPTIVFLDDDLIPHPATLVNMFQLYKRNHPCLVGRFGRLILPTQPPTYSSQTIPNKIPEAPLLLTSLMFAPQFLCRSFFQTANSLQEFVRENSNPLWNGEDLTISLMALSRFGKWGIVAGRPKHFPVKKLRSRRDLQVAISGQPCHVPYRSALLRQLAVVLRIHPSLFLHSKGLIKPKLK